MENGAKLAIKAKIAEGTFSTSDLGSYLELFAEVVNGSEEGRNQLAGWDKSFRVDFTEGESWWLLSADGRFSAGPGILEQTDVILRASADTITRILIGSKDPTAAYMGGTLKVEGGVTNALKLRALIKYVKDALAN